MPGIKELCEQRATLVPKIREMSDLIESEDRVFTAEEESAWQSLNDDYDKRSEVIKGLQETAESRTKVTNRVAELEAEQERRVSDGQPGREDTDSQGEAKPPGESRSEILEDAFAKFAERIGSDGAATHVRGNWPKYLTDARARPGYAERMGQRATPEYDRAFSRFITGGVQEARTEARALQVDLDIVGGYLVAGEQFLAELLQKVDDLVFMRQLGRVIPVPNADSLGVPTLETDPSDAVWTAEIKTGNEDSDMEFGKRNLHPAPLAKRLKVSNELLRVSIIAAEQLVRDRLAYKFAVTEENAFQNGTGNQQPLGLFTADAAGISTARDVSTGNVVDNVTTDGLINALYSLKSQYQATATWLFHRTLIRNIRKLKDGEGNYIWLSGITADKPDTILGRPFVMSEFTPSTLTTGQYVGMVGDFSFYWIAQAMDIEIKRLDELYAETNQVGFIGRQKVDGMPVLEEAFARVKLA